MSTAHLATTPTATDRLVQPQGMEHSLDALAIRVPGLLRVTPLTGVSLQFTPDPYAKVTPLSDAQHHDYAKRLEADYRRFGERDKVDATIRDLALKLIPELKEAEKNGDAAIAAVIASQGMPTAASAIMSLGDGNVSEGTLFKS